MSHDKAYINRVTMITERRRPDDALTIDELARRTGMTVRNIRAHQSRGLLPPPEIRGRTGYYGAEHVARLELIKELQADGLQPRGDQAPARDAPAAPSERGARLHARAAGAVRGRGAARSSTPASCAERWGDRRDPTLLASARASSGLLRAARRRALRGARARGSARAGDELRALGVAARARRSTWPSRLRRHAEASRAPSCELFLEEVWKPFEEAGRPEERWPEVREALERLRPLAAEVAARRCSSS